MYISDGYSHITAIVLNIQDSNNLESIAGIEIQGDNVVGTTPAGIS